MIGFRCECGPAIDCTYPKCNEGVEVSSKDITERLLDYARDYTTTTYHDDLIREAVTEIESLRQQLAAAQEREQTNDILLEQQGDKLAALNDLVSELRQQLATQSKYPPESLTWVYTHCRAIGMDCKSDSGKWEHDIALFTSNQKTQIESLRQQLAEACGLLGGSSEWIRFGSTQERYLYAKIQKFILDNQ